MAYNQSQDAVHKLGDVGQLCLGIRRDVNTTPVDTNGDYHALLFDNEGNLKVNILKGNVTVNTTGTSGIEVIQDTAADLNCTEVNSGSIKTAVEIIDDAYNTTAGTLNKHVVIGSHDASIPTTTQPHLNIAGIPAAYQYGGGGLQFDQDSSGAAHVVGPIDHDAADLRAPITLGVRGVTDITANTEVANNDVTRLHGDRLGHFLIDSGKFSVAKATINSNSNTTIVAAPGSGKKLQIYFVNVSVQPGDISLIGAEEHEGVEFSVDGGTNFFGQLVYHLGTLYTGNAGLPGMVQPHVINLQHGHWDCNENVAFSGRDMNLGAVSHDFFITVWYRTLST